MNKQYQRDRMIKIIAWVFITTITVSTNKKRGRVVETPTRNTHLQVLCFLADETMA